MTVKWILNKGLASCSLFMHGYFVWALWASLSLVFTLRLFSIYLCVLPPPPSLFPLSLDLAYARVSFCCCCMLL